MNKLNHIIRHYKSSTIFDKKIRICYYCKHLDFSNNKCKKFGKYTFINGEYDYLSAEICRYDEKKCGESAIFYEEISKNELNNKKFTFFFCNLVLYISIGGMVVTTCHLIFK